MKRQVCTVCLFVLLAFSAAIAQQDGPKQDGPKDDNPLPEAQVLGPQLIAWSELQEPKPLQQSPSQAPDHDQHAQPAAQTFTGTISKESGTYVLKVSDTSSYKLDDQDQAKQYEGQRVRVFGTLESSSDLIRVQKIEPIS